MVRAGTTSLVCSGHVMGGFFPDVRVYDRGERSIVLKTGAYEMMGRCKERIFATYQFVSHREAKISTVLVSAGGEVAGEVWVCKIWLLVRLRTGRPQVIEKMAYIQ